MGGNKCHICKWKSEEPACGEYGAILTEPDSENLIMDSCGVMGKGMIRGYIIITHDGLAKRVKKIEDAESWEVYLQNFVQPTESWEKYLKNFIQPSDEK